MRRRRGRRYERFWPAYVPVAERRAKAERAMQKLRTKGAAIRPVTIEGRTIARTFWGKGWCDHLESFGDYSNRLPRGRTYVRNGSVCDLHIARGRIEARVAGSNLYRVRVEVKPLAPGRWKALKQRCVGRIGSLIELLQGRLSDEIMGAVTDRDAGLFPRPGEIDYTCDCPDWADMCKHVSAVMYGIGARLDEEPEMLFLLRGVDHNDLVSGETAAAAALAGGGSRRSRRRKLADADLAAVFGVEMEDAAVASTASPPAEPAKPGRTAHKTGARASRPRARGRPPSASEEPRARTEAAGPQDPVPFEPTGRAVALLRKRLAMSVTAFARAVGVSSGSVTNWERHDGILHPHARSLAGLQRLHAEVSAGRPAAPKRPRKRPRENR